MISKNKISLEKSTAQILVACISFISMVIFSFPSRAVIAKNICILKISDILQHLPEKGNTVAIFDWDQTISAEEGGYEPREVGKDGTLEVIKALHQKGIKTIVLTARGEGRDHPEAQIKTIVNYMHKNLGQDWLGNGALADDAFKRYTNDQLMKDRIIYVLALGQIVFGGGGFKGEATTKLLDSAAFKEVPDNVLFIDNDKKNIAIFADIFRNRKEHAYIFHYPNPIGVKFMPLSDEACQPGGELDPLSLESVINTAAEYEKIDRIKLLLKRAPAGLLEQVLSIAVKNEHNKARDLMVDLLLDIHADILAEVLNLAVENDHNELSDFLANKVEPTNIRTALFHAVQTGANKALKFWLSKFKGDVDDIIKDHETLLQRAVQGKNIEALRLLLARMSAKGIVPALKMALMTDQKNIAREIVTAINSKPYYVELRQKIKTNPEANWYQSYDWMGFDFNGLDLSNANFSKKDLTAANFTNAILIQTNFSDALLNDAIFDSANLRGAIFKQAILKNASLKNANLDQSDISTEQLQSASNYCGAMLPQFHRSGIAPP